MGSHLSSSMSLCPLQERLRKTNRLVKKPRAPQHSHSAGDVAAAGGAAAGATPHPQRGGADGAAPVPVRNGRSPPNLAALLMGLGGSAKGGAAAAAARPQPSEPSSSDAGGARACALLHCDGRAIGHAQYCQISSSCAAIAADLHLAEVGTGIGCAAECDTQRAGYPCSFHRNCIWLLRLEQREKGGCWAVGDGSACAGVNPKLKNPETRAGGEELQAGSRSGSQAQLRRRRSAAEQWTFVRASVSAALRFRRAGELRRQSKEQGHEPT